MTDKPFLVEAVQLSADAFTDDSIGAQARGWRPVEVQGLVDGVQNVEVAALPDGTAITSVLHAVEGSYAGGRTLALSFRGIDEGAPEFLFQVAPDVRAFDLYLQAHAPVVQAALEGAAEEGVDRVLITGHSLGGILAEKAAAALLPGSGLEGKVVVVTSGSPGSDADASGLRVVNLVHTEDRIAELSTVPVLDFAAREGTDLVIDLPGVDAPPLPALDSEEALVEAVSDQALFAEHGVDLYLRSAAALEAEGGKVPGTRDVAGDARFFFSKADRFVLGTKGADALHGAGKLDVVLGLGGDDRIEAGGGDDRLIGGGGDDRLCADAGADNLSGRRGDDRLDGGDGNDRLYGNGGDDRLKGGAGDDYLSGGLGDDRLWGGDGDDLLAVGRGFDRIDGGSGHDTLVVEGAQRRLRRSGPPRRGLQAPGPVRPRYRRRCAPTSSGSCSATATPTTRRRRGSSRPSRRFSSRCAFAPHGAATSTPSSGCSPTTSTAGRARICASRSPAPTPGRSRGSRPTRTRKSSSPRSTGRWSAACNRPSSRASRTGAR